MTYGGIEQRWMIVESEERKKLDSKKILNCVEKEAKKASKEISKIVKLEFEQSSLALKKRLSRLNSVKCSCRYISPINPGEPSRLVNGSYLNDLMPTFRTSEK